MWVAAESICFTCELWFGNNLRNPLSGPSINPYISLNSLEFACGGLMKFALKITSLPQPPIYQLCLWISNNVPRSHEILVFVSKKMANNVWIMQRYGKCSPIRQILATHVDQ